MAENEKIQKTLQTCFACGVCSASCPARRFSDEFNPVKITRLILLGYKNELIKSPTIWLCAKCNTCIERCPRRVAFVDVIIELQNEAVREGIVSDQLKMAAKNLLENGWLYRLSDSDEARAEMGLSPSPKADVEAVKKLAKRRGFDKFREE